MDRRIVWLAVSRVDQAICSLDSIADSQSLRFKRQNLAAKPPNRLGLNPNLPKRGESWNCYSAPGACGVGNL